MTPQSHPPAPNGDPKFHLLERYLAGELHGDARAHVEQWLSEHRDAAGMITELIDDVSERSVSAPNARDALATIHARMNGGFVSTPVVQTSRTPTPSEKRQHTHAWYSTATARVTAAGIAAAGIAAAILVGIVHSYRSTSLSNPAEASKFSYVTANGQRANITLSDGSQVVLNVGSRLDVPPDYAQGNRTVHLSGEALFLVNHRGKSPFTVVSGAANTHVLGTCFMVRHYTTDSTTVVAVREGRVAVQSAVLSALQEINVTHAGTISAIHPADTARFTFASGVLTLNDVALRDAIPDLNRWYNVDIHLSDPGLGQRKLEGGFIAGSPSDLIADLEMTFDVHVVREGRTLTIYPR